MMKLKEFLFTAFYAGYSPIAPGTAGTLVAMAIYIAENIIFSGVEKETLNIINFIVVVALIIHLSGFQMMLKGSITQKIPSVLLLMR